MTNSKERKGLEAFLKWIVPSVGMVVQFLALVDKVTTYWNLRYGLVLSIAAYGVVAGYFVWKRWYVAEATNREKEFALIGLCVTTAVMYTYFAIWYVNKSKIEAVLEANKTEVARLLIDLPFAKDTDSAIKMLGEIIDKNPSNAEAYSLLGAAEYSKKRFAEAVTNYQKALSLVPADDRYKHGLAASLREACNYDEATRIYEQLLVKNPAGPSANYNLAVAYHLKREFDKAIAKYDVVIGSNRGRVESALYNKAAAISQKLMGEPNNPLSENLIRDAIRNLKRAVMMGGGARLEKIKRMAQQPSVDSTCPGHILTEDISGLNRFEVFRTWLQGEAQALVQ